MCNRGHPLNYDERMPRVFALFLAILMTSSTSWAQDCVGPMPGSRSLLKGMKAVFVGTLIESAALLRFRVDENIKGAGGGYFEIEGSPLGQGHFEVGKAYLVFVESIRLQDGEHLAAPKCGRPSRELKYASALLEQVRAEKTGRKNASVYGMLLRRSELPDLSGRYAPAIPNIVVKLQSKSGSFTTITDGQGAYAFERLPKGTYQVSAQLPPNLQLAETITHRAPSPFELPRGSCFENDITALPTGKISGRVIGPDGVPLDDLVVSLYPASLYDPSTEGEWGYQGASSPFVFEGLPAGDYILIFNRSGRLDPNAPFPRTFYPGGSDLHAAKVIHLGDGQELSNADIQLPESAVPTRKLMVRLVWDGPKPDDYYAPQIMGQATQGVSHDATKIADVSYALNLLLQAKYTIQGKAYCRIGTGQVETGSITVDGSDTATTQVTLTFRKGECLRR